MSMSFNKIAILTTCGADGFCFISRIGKSEAINTTQNVDFTKSGTL